jgi:hypothetical protein
VKWTGHKELNYCKKGGYKVVGRVVIIRWHQAWGVEEKKGEGKKRIDKKRTQQL